jgi:hypothetical protein
MNTPSYLAIKNGNDCCVVVFSSFAARDYGPLTFSYKGHFEKYVGSSDLIFVKDVKNQWYNRQLPGLGDNVADITEGLRRLTRGYRKVSTFGSSMGGYASILYGGMLGAEHVVALSPQTLLREPFPRYNRKIHKGTYLDLSGVGTPRASKYTVIVGEEELFDIYQADELRQKRGIDYTVAPIAAHNVVKLLDERGSLDRVIGELCGASETGYIDSLLGQFRAKARVSEVLGDKEFSGALSTAVELYFKDRVAALPFLQRLLLSVPDWSGAMSKLGMCHFAAGNQDDALALFEAVASCSNTIYEFYPTYAAYLARGGDVERVVELVAKAVRMESLNKSIFLSVAEIFEGLNMEAAAKDCRDRWSKVK